MRGRGRPKVDNEEVLQTILSDKELRTVLFARLKELVALVDIIEMHSSSLKDAIDSTTERTGLTKGFIGKLARLYAKGKLTTYIQEAEQFRELMELSTTQSSDDEDEVESGAENIINDPVHNTTFEQPEVDEEQDRFDRY